MSVCLCPKRHLLAEECMLYVMYDFALRCCVLCEVTWCSIWTLSAAKNVCYLRRCFCFHVDYEQYFSRSFLFFFIAIRDGVKFENRSLVDQIERQHKVLVSSDQERFAPQSRDVVASESRSRQRHRHVCSPPEPMFAAQRWICSVSTNYFTSLGLDLTNFCTDVNNVDSFQTIGAKLYLAFD